MDDAARAAVTSIVTPVSLTGISNGLFEVCGAEGVSTGLSIGIFTAVSMLRFLLVAPVKDEGGAVFMAVVCLDVCGGGSVSIDAGGAVKGEVGCGAGSDAASEKDSIE